MKKLTLGILGSGYLGGIIAEAWKNGFLDEYELVGIAGRNMEKTNALAEKVGVHPCKTTEELLSLKPDYIAEAASVEAVKEIAEKALSNGSNLVVLSIGAFADSDFYEKVKKVAAENGTKVYIASGAVGGFDVLRTISLMGQAKVHFKAQKNPKALQNTELFEEHMMTDTKSCQAFEGSAKEAIALLPTKVNVAVATSLASVGPENTKMVIHSVPGFVGDEHTTTSEIEGVKAVIDIYSSSAAIAAWSVVAVLQNVVSPIVF